VVGLGRAGFAAARALAGKAGPGAVRAWDGAADAAQRERAEALRELGVEVWLGGDGLEALGGAKAVVKSPGVPPEAAVVAEATRRGLEVVDELDVGWRLVPSPTVAVTGTNGKSTVSSLCVDVLAAHGLAPVLAGNTEYGPPLSEVSLGPTPAAVVAEVSSYQAESSTALGVDAAIFTNLTPEHLNRHATMEAYGEAKRRLFLREDWCVPLASLNVGDELGRRLAAEIEGRGGRALTYGAAAGAGYRIASCRWGLREAEVVIEAPDGVVRLETRLPGAHNAANVAAVLALADGLGLAREPTLEALAAAAPVPGRFEVLDLEAPFDVVVDFAIAPDSVANVLETARSAARARSGRLVTVLAVMGRGAPMIGRESGDLARGLSDHLVLSGSTYRGEPRIVALEALVAGAGATRGDDLETVIDRRKAIARGLAVARPGDVVAILGRGPTAREATDTRGGFRELDDRQVVRELL
jgi:UDP-N-acetylmuramoylalanine-D-glutamate ligase